MTDTDSVFDNLASFGKQETSFKDKKTTLNKQKEKEPKNKIDGWLAIDKPYGVTCVNVLNTLKRVFNPQKIGHAGTLDPLATGVLPIAFGSATKFVDFVFDSKKIYEFTIKWGEETDTYDAEGEVIFTSETRPSKEEIEQVLPSFIGKVMQSPPAYSAIKLAGQRAYSMARKGKKVAIPPREIEISNLILKDCHNRDYASFEVVCGKGTYVRSLAHDIAKKLGTCGHVSKLRRTKCGPFYEKDAILLEKITNLEHIAIDSVILPLDTTLDDIPALAVNRQEAGALSLGFTVPVLPIVLRNKVTELPKASVIRMTYKGKTVSLAEICGVEFRLVKAVVQDLNY